MKKIVINDGYQTPLEILKEKQLNCKDYVGVLVNNELYDLRDTINGNGYILLLEPWDFQGEDIIRHSLAHILAQSILRLFPQVKIAVGPTTINGFFYDIDVDYNLSFEDLKVIEKTMMDIIDEDIIIEKKIINRLEAIELFQQKEQWYKVAILETIPDEEVTIYEQGDFFDLCKGPHGYSTGSIPKFFNLYNISEVDWVKGGDNTKNRLQRIYGVGFAKEEGLKKYHIQLEQQKSMDHRKIGWDNELVNFHPEFCSGGAFWEPKGFIIYNEIIQYIRKTINNYGYHEVKTPQLYNENLWQLSGHWDHYQDGMFKIPVKNSDEINYISPKPMNCPAHIVLFNSRIRSYKDLPLRLAEFGSCCRNESSGSLDGLMRMREFIQDDAHIFCTEDQIQSETITFCNLLKEVYNKFGFKDIKIVISTRPEKRFGNDSIWDKSEKALMDAMDILNQEYIISPGDGAFYGPKLEFSLKDRMGRYWQCGTFQLDFVLPERMGAKYINNESKLMTPVICHRAILGSIERFLGILLENNGGNFPFWLSPVQISVLTISEDYNEYGENIIKNLKNFYRITLDDHNDTLSKKIKTNIQKKIPIMIIVGHQESMKNTIVIRDKKGNNKEMDKDDIIGINNFINEFIGE